MFLGVLVELSILGTKLLLLVLHSGILLVSSTTHLLVDMMAVIEYLIFGIVGEPMLDILTAFGKQGLKAMLT